jgi:RimJ/RimL family protein N-acetyltransferase
MIGDVNLYLMSDDNESDNEYLPAAEIEVMIAEESMRGKRLAGEAVRIMMRFAKERLGIYRFVAKISEKNQQSLKLFTVGLGFTEVSRSKVFQEVTLQHIYKDDTTALHVQFVEEKFDSLKL